MGVKWSFGINLIFVIWSWPLGTQICERGGIQLGYGEDEKAFSFSQDTIFLWGWGDCGACNMLVTTVLRAARMVLNRVNRNP